MALLLHISIALSSIVAVSFLFISPTKQKFTLSYGLVFFTIVSGSYLVATKPAHMIQACSVGLVYISVMLVGILSARRKLATQKKIN